MSMGGDDTTKIPILVNMPAVTVFTSYRYLLQKRRQQELEQKIKEGFKK